MQMAGKHRQAGVFGPIAEEPLVPGAKTVLCASGGTVLSSILSKFQTLMFGASGFNTFTLLYNAGARFQTMGLKQGGLEVMKMAKVFKSSYIPWGP